MIRESGSPLSAADQYHVGIVADDPAATMAQLTQILGYEWCDQIGGTITVALPGGDVTVEMRTWYSKTTPRLEVVQSHPGTVWTPASSGLHHFGYWVDDVAAAITTLEVNGYTFEGCSARRRWPGWACRRRSRRSSRSRYPTARASSMASTCSSMAG
jgi:hypothetical protein